MAVLSSMSSHSRPTLGICTKWSITEIDEKPTSSAAPGDGAEPVGGLGRAAGPREPTDLQAEAHGHGVLLLAAGGGRRVVERGGHDLDRLVRAARWTASNPSPRRSPSTAAAIARSWLVTSADGHRLGPRPVAGPALPLGRVDEHGVARHAGRVGQGPAAGPGRRASRAVESTTVSRPPAEPLGDDQLEHLEGVGAGPQVVAVAPDDGPQVVPGHDRPTGRTTCRPTSTCRIRPRRPARRGTGRATHDRSRTDGPGGGRRGPGRR